MGKTTVYGLAPWAKRRELWRLLFLSCGCAITMVGAVAVIHAVGETDTAGALAVLFALLFAGFVAWFAFVYSRLTAATATVSDEGLECRGGIRLEVQRFAYSGMSNLDIKESSSGAVAVIRVRHESGATAGLWGFEDMEAIARRLERAAPKNCAVQRERQLLDWSSPLVSLVFGALVSLPGWYGLILALTYHGPAR